MRKCACDGRPGTGFGAAWVTAVDEISVFSVILRIKVRQGPDMNEVLSRFIVAFDIKHNTF